MVSTTPQIAFKKQRSDACSHRLRVVATVTERAAVSKLLDPFNQELYQLLELLGRDFVIRF